MLKNFFPFYPVLATLVMATFFQTLIMGVTVPQPPLTPLEETTDEPTELTTPTPYINTLIVLGVIFAGSVLMVILLKHRRVLRFFVMAVLFLTASAVTFFYFLLSFNADLSVVSAVSFVVGVLVVFGVFSSREWVNVFASAYVASSCGVVFGYSMPFWTSFVLLVAVSLYDTVAVFKGHLKVLGQIDLTEVKGLVVSFHGLSIGLGDLFFYTVLFSFVTTNFGWLPGMFSIAGLLSGYLLTLKLAQKRAVFPGLPITLITALAASSMIYFMLS
ncbi:MAG: presenilin family intramembrane aspartyl protease [Candidatus Caldarchaeum sp.]|nr:presenilin family intramembrane aspartyl protease [Candidatus Caldarchaeum sp.]